jgi:phosphatidylinositol-3-phosphatase
VVVVIEENHSYNDIIGSAQAPYINSLADQGALFTASFAVGHPSQPNYLALFSGSTQGISDDSCPHTFTTGNLGAQLIAAGLGFAGYSESLPTAGFTGCSAGAYARKHNPWGNFPSVPASANQPWSAFPTDYTTLPTVSFVVPNLMNDMHDGTIGEADNWLRTGLDGYVTWARTHRSLLIVTWDEDDLSQANQIPTIIVGASVKPGRYTERIDHYRLLRTLETAYGLPPLGAAASAEPITDCWSNTG